MEEGEEDEEEEVEYEVLKPKKRIGRPPKVWSSVLLPKEVTSALGSGKPSLPKAQKATKSSTCNEGESSYPKLPTSNMVGQPVYGVVDGSFDAGFLVSLRMGDSDTLYRGVVFGPGLSIPVSKDTDVAKNIIRRKRKTKAAGGTSSKEEEEPSTSPPPMPSLPAKEEPTSNLVITQPSLPPPHYEAPPVQQVHHQTMESPLVNAPIPPPHPHQFAYNGAVHGNSYRAPHPHPEMNMNSFAHGSNFPSRPSVSMPAPQGYGSRQNFGHVMPSSSAPYGYSFGGTQGRPTTPLPPQYQGQTDPQYRGQ